MQNHKIVVLGSNSFAGSIFVGVALERGCRVLGLSRSPEPHPVFLSYAPQEHFEFRQLDLNQHLTKIIEVLSKTRPEIIVDFAAQSMVAESWQSPEQWYQTNIVSKVRLHQWLKDQAWLQKYIRISTPEVYGSCDSLMDEQQEYSPTTPYAVSQAAIDMSLRAFHRQYGFPVVTGRFANFYGEHQQLYRLIPKTILSILSGTKLPLHGGGKSIRSFIHGKDVADSIFSMIELGKTGEVYHFSPKLFFSIRDVVQMICNRLECKLEDAVEESCDRPGKDQAYLMDAHKAKIELRIVPKISLEKGLESTIQWVKKNYGCLAKMPRNYTHRV